MKIIEKSNYNGIPFWKAYHECGFYYELHINKIQGKIGIIERPASINHLPMRQFDFKDDFDKFILDNFNEETLIELKDFIK